MDLQALGFDDWLGEHADALLRPGLRLSRVMAVDRSALRVRNERGETSAKLAGKFRFAVESKSDIPCVGDWVCVEHHASSGPAIIHSVLPRRTFLRRKCAGKTVGFQMIGANIDVAFIVQACQYDFNLRRLDRYLVMAKEGQIEPIVVLSKIDLVSPEELAAMVAQISEADISTKILPLSNMTGIGVEAFRNLLVSGKTYCMLGSSGVGKTTLLNRLVGRDAFETKAVSGTGEGVHTTSRSQLIVLDNGAMLVDTPGRRELGLLGTSEGMDDSFEDIQDLSLNCRFSNCTHVQEPGCAVLLAIEAGDLSEARFQSYLKLKKETEYHDLSYVKKRKKDRSFGRFIKSVKKQGKHGK